MSNRPSKQSVAKLCGVFDNPTEEMRNICAEMLKEKDPNEEINGIKLDNAQVILALGFRELLSAFIKQKLTPYESHPFYDLILEICEVKRLELELGESLQYLKFVNEYRFVFYHDGPQSRDPWTMRLINDPRDARISLENAIGEIIGEKDSFFSASNTNMTDTQIDYVRTVNHSWSPKSPDMLKERTGDEFRAYWNELLTQQLKHHVSRLLSNVTKRAKIGNIPEQLTKIFASLEFTFLSRYDLNQILEFLSENLLSMVEELSGSQRVQAKTAGRLPLSKENIEDLFETIRYPLAYPQVGELAAKRVKEDLIKQFKGLEIEPSLIGRLKVYMRDRFTKALVPPGHRVGMIAAQAAGENASQAGLRSFHHAGISSGTGFDRIHSITKMSKKNPFTTIALKGMPGRDKVYQYSQMIESTLVGDICQFSIGRTDESVEEAHEIFKDTPVYAAEEGGWQERYIELVKVLGEKKKSRPLQRPPWIIRLTCDRDAMVQKKISMYDISSAIEEVKKDVRVIPSDIIEGIIDIYVDISSVAKNSSAIYQYLRLYALNTIRNVRVKGLSSFEKTLVEKYSIIKFIDAIEQKGEDTLVTFSKKDVAYNGVPVDQIIGLLKIKADNENVKIDHENDYEYMLRNTNAKKLRSRLIEQDVVLLSDVVPKEVREEEGILRVQLDKDLLQKTHEVSVVALIDFFSRQNGLRQFESVDIHFNRHTFLLTLSHAQSFGPDSILQNMREAQILPEDILTTAQKDDMTLRFPEIPTSLDVSKLETFVASYGIVMQLNVNKKPENLEVVEFELVLNPLDLNTAFQMLLRVVNGCKPIPSVFTSNARQKYSDRYRILAKGVNTLQLTTLPFVNIYASIPSSPMEIFEYFDIEATQSYCYSELVINGGKDVGNRHLGLLADTLTYMGVPVKMDITGKKATEGGVLAVASFQQTFQIMLDSSAANLSDDIRGNVSITLVGDFSRSERSKKVHEDPRLDSAVEQLMNATTTKAGHAAKVPEKTHRRRKITRGVPEPEQPVPKTSAKDLNDRANELSENIIL